MKLYVAHDEKGRILAAAEAGKKGAGDRPVPRPGMSVVELEVPKELADSKLSDFAHRLQVDVAAKKLVVKP
jgi:hypothetical protein